MIRRRHEQRSVFELYLPDGEKLWPEELRRIDKVLEDEAVIDTMCEGLGRRWPQSTRRGRSGTPAEVVLRMLVLKHLFKWSYDELEREVRANLVYRAFARVGAEKVPDAKTILKITRALGPEVIEQLHSRVVALAIRAGGSKGRRFRIDTTVVETNIHYPTDSSLLSDGIRVVTRVVKRVENLIGAGRRRMRNYGRSVKRQCMKIRLLARSPKNRDQQVEVYRKLMTTARKVVREGKRTGRRMQVRLRGAASTGEWKRRLGNVKEELNIFCNRLEKVLEQTKQRVFGGDTHVPNKLLSVFETHTEAIRKGKMDKPTEFGKMVTIQEAEGGLVTAYEVQGRRQWDSKLWEPALDKHAQIFGRAPYLAAADRGFSSKWNEEVAQQLGVRHVCLPKKGRISQQRRRHQRQRWFRRGQRWRAGSEACISVLKRRHGLDRCLYRSEDGIQKWVGLGVIASNLLTIGRRPAASRPRSTI
jgi:IS5 family transposase